jgi:LPS-assembly protein
MIFGNRFRASFFAPARFGLLAGFCAWLGLALVTASPVLAEPSGPKEPLLQADRMDYDEETKTVTATGNVEVAMDDQILRADKVTYNKDTDVVRATGNVVITQTAVRFSTQATLR